VSTLVELGKVLGPSFVALGSIYFTYRSGASQSRIGRHHSRIETLYMEMLDHMLEVNRTFLGVPSDARDEVVKNRKDPLRLDARVQLFAHELVQRVWFDAMDEISAPPARARLRSPARQPGGRQSRGEWVAGRRHAGVGG
jgi:hypothetical protein